MIHMIINFSKIVWSKIKGRYIEMKSFPNNDIQIVCKKFSHSGVWAANSRFSLKNFNDHPMCQFKSFKLTNA